MKNNLVLIILSIISVAFLLFFLSLYEEMFLDLYEENRADRWANYISLTLLSGILMFLIITGGYSSFQKKNTTFLKFLKEIFITSVLLFGLHFFLIRPPLSGAIQMINAIGLLSESVYVEGMTTQVNSQKIILFQRHQLTVKANDGQEYFFTVDKHEVDKYKEGRLVMKHMRRGVLGLLYK